MLAPLVCMQVGDKVRFQSKTGMNEDREVVIQKIDTSPDGNLRYWCNFTKDLDCWCEEKYLSLIEPLKKHRMGSKCK